MARHAPVIASPAPGGDGPARMRPSHRMIFEVLLARQRAGARDTTDAEIQEALERLHAPRRFDRAWIAGRISEMKAASPALVLEVPEKRQRRPHAGHRWGVVRPRTFRASGWRVGRCLSGYRIGWRRRGQRQLLIGRHGTRTQYQAGVFKNEDLAECSPWARLCFAGLWTLADREGRLEDRPKRIKGELFAFDTVDVDPLLGELEKYGFIMRYEAEGIRVIQILKFDLHQHPHHKEPSSDLPSPKSPGFAVMKASSMG